MFSSKTLFSLLALASVIVAGPLPQDYGHSHGSVAASHAPRQDMSGQATFYSQKGVAGACGQVHSDSDHIVALQTKTYNNGANCGRTIAITDTKTGKTANGVVADECPTCASADDIDLSIGLFTEFASKDVGVIPVTWHFV